jgi:hypothetical protein
MSHIYYGADLNNFGSLQLSMVTLFLMLMGDLEALDDMIVLNKTLSFFLFVLFITSMQFILMNMFIAFVSKSYTDEDNEYGRMSKPLADELKEHHWTIIMRDFVRKQLNRFCCGFLNNKTKLMKGGSSMTDAVREVSRGPSRSVQNA